MSKRSSKNAKFVGSFQYTLKNQDDVQDRRARDDLKWRRSAQAALGAALDEATALETEAALIARDLESVTEPQRPDVLRRARRGWCLCTGASWAPTTVP